MKAPAPKGRRERGGEEQKRTTMNKKETAQKTDRPITAEVAKFMHFHRDGDIIPHGWNKKIGDWHDYKNKKTGEIVKGWRSRPFAERLLARIVWFYTPTPVKNDSGEVTGWQRKFRAGYWQMNPVEMAQALGCSRQTIVDELSLLRELGLITTQASRDKTKADGNRNVPLFVIPVFDAIVGLTTASQETTPVASKESCLAASKETTPAASKESLQFLSIPTLNANKEVRGATAPRLAKNSDPFFDKLADLTKTDPKLQGAMIGKTKSKLLKVAATLHDLDCFKAYWYAQDWRGKKGEVPSLPQVVSEWTKAKTWEGNSQSAGASTNNGEWEWATIPTGIVLRHKGGTFPSLRGEEAKQKAREVGLEVIF